MFERFGSSVSLECGIYLARIDLETGAAHGADCPKCRKLAEMIHEIEDGRRPMTDDNLLELLQA